VRGLPFREKPTSIRGITSFIIAGSCITWINFQLIDSHIQVIVESETVLKLCFKFLRWNRLTKQCINSRNMKWDPTFLKCNGEENVLHLLLKYNETQRKREQVLCTKQLNTLEEITQKQMKSCKKI
jgi:hypothetical protein